ncbi:isochorismate synthase [Aestuariimicrobium kwangyangense]|uniref:isochorismate synthase n=1 Tax=Aestuariimicrobium kwangyangense TaxID=396389 RepID=UPI0003B2E41C|nr:isochorismate synthase [Aestuariimicrobium kwangyangense]
MILNPGSARLRARTVAIPDPGPLETYLPRDGASAFLRKGDGIVGIGEVARFATDSLDAADIWWTEFSATIEHETELYGQYGTGPVALGSFAFDPDHSNEPSVLVVPEVVIGRRDGQSWYTRLGYGRLVDDPPERQPAPEAPGELSWSDGAMSGVDWELMVGEAVKMLNRGELEKIVLARDLIARASGPIDPRWVVERLTISYANTWTFLLDGLLGATPEMLVRRRGGLATSRVLAGTIRRGTDDEASRLAEALRSSSKNLREHEYAVRSVAERLAPFCSGMNVPEAPSILELPNVLHLATDITGAVVDNVTALALAAAVHPSAAVCGSPTHVALDLINELETLDRGRYAGPVGWIDTAGDGEWALALRSGQIHQATPNEIQIYAGAGIMSDSNPAEELAETIAKFRPMRDALSG